MRVNGILAALALAAGVAGAAQPAAGADDLKAVARATAAKTAKAVVTVKLVLKMKMGGERGGREQEAKVEVVGTVVDPSGLTVASAAAIEPTSLLGRIGRGRG